MGEGDNHGIVPKFSKELFERVEGTTDDEVITTRQLMDSPLFNMFSFGFRQLSKFKSATMRFTKRRYSIS